MRTWRWNFPLLLEKGLDGLREKVAERRSRINLTALEDLHGEQFLKRLISCWWQSVNTLNVSLPLARAMAATETRKAVAMNCWRWQKTQIYRPPAAADFLQALRLCYFIQLILQIDQ
ncbi:pyruvate formate lyase family protein [Shigella flexneri]